MDRNRAVVVEAITDLRPHILRRDAIGRFLQLPRDVVENPVLRACFGFGAFDQGEIDRPQAHGLAHHAAAGIDLQRGSRQLI